MTLLQMSKECYSDAAATYLEGIPEFKLFPHKEIFYPKRVLESYTNI